MFYDTYFAITDDGLFDYAILGCLFMQMHHVVIDIHNKLVHFGGFDYDQFYMTMRKNKNCVGLMATVSGPHTHHRLQKVILSLYGAFNWAL